MSGNMGEKKIGFSYRKIIVSLMVLGAYGALSIYLLLHHEPWRDEAQAWLIARDLSFGGILRQMGYEGHPALWHMILFPFVKAGCPIIVETVCSTVIMYIAAVIFWFRVSLGRWLKVVMLFSPLFLFYLPTIARSYCLVALFMVCIMALYPNREKHPVWYGLAIAGLVQTHIIMLMTAALLSMWFLVERFCQYRKEGTQVCIRKLAVLMIPLVSAILLLLQLFSKTSAGISKFSIFDMLTPLSFGKGIWYEVKLCTHMLLGLNEDWQCLCILAVLVGSIALAVKYHVWKETVVFLISSIYMLFVCRYLTSASYQRALVWCYLLVWMIMVVEHKVHNKSVRGWQGSISTVLLIMVCALSIQGKTDIQSDIKGLYSDGKNTAQFIQDHIPEDEMILTAEPSKTSSVAAYLKGIRFWSPLRHRYISYTTWEAVLDEKQTYMEFMAAAKEQFPEKTSFYILVPNESKISDLEQVKMGWNKIYQTEKSNVTNEMYAIYQVNNIG